MGFSEKRKYPRVAESVSCELTVAGDSVVAETTNISCGGALCRLTKPVPAMTQLDIAFKLPGSSRIIRCIGVVVRQEQAGAEYQTAIYFSNLKPEDRRLIAEFVLQSMLTHDRRRP
jgi:c-di-GMP-binding flagellar brake protein YcgR